MVQRGGELMKTQTYEMTHYELAEIGTRAAAWLIDGAILFFIESALFFGARETNLGLGLIVSLAYTWFFLTRREGQTPGKMLMKIRVIKTDGSPISDRDAVLRYIGSLINYIGCIGWLWTLIDDNRQGWHDKIAQTYVVMAE
jgi:uncharacterized RDD family membrane protein YckC